MLLSMLIGVVIYTRLAQQEQHIFAIQSGSYFIFHFVFILPKYQMGKGPHGPIFIK